MGVRHELAGMVEHRRRLVAVAGAAAAVLAAAGLFVAASGGDGAPYGCDHDDYPFTSIPCPVFQSGENRVAAAGPEMEARVKVSAEQATAAARAKNGAEAKILEARLVWAWSAESTDPKRDRELLWAVSAELPGGVFISGGAFFGHAVWLEQQKGDPSRKLTDAEMAEAGEEANRELEAYRATLTYQYHVDSIDPETGEWLSSFEGAGP